MLLIILKRYLEKIYSLLDTGKDLTRLSTLHLFSAPNELNITTKNTAIIETNKSSGKINELIIPRLNVNIMVLFIDIIFIYCILKRYSMFFIDHPPNKY